MNMSMRIEYSENNNDFRTQIIDDRGVYVYNVTLSTRDDILCFIQMAIKNIVAKESIRQQNLIGRAQ